VRDLTVLCAAGCAPTGDLAALTQNGAGAIFARRCLCMSTGITGAKIVVMAVLLAIVLIATPAMDVLGKYDVWPNAAVQGQVTPPRPKPQVTSKPLPRVRARTKSAPSRLMRSAAGPSVAYEVPEGAVLAAFVRSKLDSASTRPEAKVRAILRTAVRESGMELIPAASIIHGKVLDVVPASRWQPRGRIVVGFYFIEHGTLGTRIAIATRPVVFEPVDAIGKSIVARPTDVRVNAGDLLAITLAERLVVRLPRKDE
jgi:hypothetical protein